MIKIKMVRVTHPELIGCITQDGEDFFEYRCKVCGYGVADGDRFCACCGNELNWRGMDKTSKEFKRLLDSL